MTSLIMSSCCTLRLKRRRAFSRDSPSCSRISAKPTHPQTRPEGPNSYYKDFTGSQGESGKTFTEQAEADADKTLQMLAKVLPLFVRLRHQTHFYVFQ